MQMNYLYRAYRHMYTTALEVFTLPRILGPAIIGNIRHSMGHKGEDGGSNDTILSTIANEILNRCW